MNRFLRPIITGAIVGALAVTAGTTVGLVVMRRPEHLDATPPVVAPALPPVPSELLLEQAAAGRSCDPEPVLTDHIIFTFLSGETTVLGFDAAFEAAESGAGHVRLYCLEAAA